MKTTNSANEKTKSEKVTFEPPSVQEMKTEFLKRYKGDTYIIPEDRIEEDNNKDM